MRCLSLRRVKAWATTWLGKFIVQCFCFFCHFYTAENLNLIWSLTCFQWRVTSHFSLTKNDILVRFMKALGKAADVDSLCSIKLRALIETENKITPSSLAQNAVSHHLGHSPRMRDEHYVLPDRRLAVQCANRLLFLLEEAGETDDGGWCEEAICESADSVRDYWIMRRFDFNVIVSCFIQTVGD